jgi:hypothetical protein
MKSYKNYDEALGDKLFLESVRAEAKAMELEGQVPNLETCKRRAMITTFKNALLVISKLKRLGVMNNAEYVDFRRKLLRGIADMQVPGAFNKRDDDD